MNPGFAERTVDPLTLLVLVGVIAAYLLLPFLYFRIVMHRSGLLGRTHRFDPFLTEGPAGGLDVPTAQEKRYVRRHQWTTSAMTIGGLFLIILVFGTDAAEN